MIVNIDATGLVLRMTISSLEMSHHNTIILPDGQSHTSLLQEYLAWAQGLVMTDSLITGDTGDKPWAQVCDTGDQPWAQVSTLSPSQPMLISVPLCHILLLSHGQLISDNKNKLVVLLVVSRPIAIHSTELHGPFLDSLICQVLRR